MKRADTSFSVIVTAMKRADSLSVIVTSHEECTEESEHFF